LGWIEWPADVGVDGRARTDLRRPDPLLGIGSSSIIYLMRTTIQAAEDPLARLLALTPPVETGRFALPRQPVVGFYRTKK
jgi:hypothetical protein